MNSRRVPQSLLVILFVLILSSNLVAGIRDYVPIVRATYPEKTIQQFYELATYYYSRGDSVASEFFAKLYQEGSWTGSGFVYVDKNGNNYIITNRHVAIQALNVDLEFEKEIGGSSKYDDCQILYVANDMDLAVIQFPNKKKVFKRGFKLNTNFQEDGTTVYSAGYPGLMGSTGWQFATGNVSNARANPPYISGPYPYLIQHTAPIDPGNSGGPLTIRDKTSPTGFSVVGVNTWTIRQRSNTFFSIPTASVVEILEKAKQSENVLNNKALLKKELIKSCKILAAELGSEHLKAKEIKKFISYEFVAEAGVSSVLQMLTLGLPEITYENLEHDAIETMRSSIFFHFWLSLQDRAEGDLSNISFVGINFADEDKIGSIHKIRTNFLVSGQKTEIEWVFEYGNWRVGHLFLVDILPVDSDIDSDAVKDKDDVDKGSAPFQITSDSKGQFMIGLILGMGLPRGDLASDDQYVYTDLSNFLDPIEEGPLANSTSGIGLGLSVDYMVMSKLSIGAKFFRTSLGFSDDNDYEGDNMDNSHSMTNYGVNTKYRFNPSPNSPYLGVALGFHAEKYELKGTKIYSIAGDNYIVPFNVNRSSSDIGVSLMAGYIYTLNDILKLGIEGNYHKVLNSESVQVDMGTYYKDVDLSTEYMTVSARIMYMPKRK